MKKNPTNCWKITVKMINAADHSPNLCHFYLHARKMCASGSTSRGRVSAWRDLSPHRGARREAPHSREHSPLPTCLFSSFLQQQPLTKPSVRLHAAQLCPAVAMWCPVAAVLEDLVLPVTSWSHAVSLLLLLPLASMPERALSLSTGMVPVGTSRVSLNF